MACTRLIRGPAPKVALAYHFRMIDLHCHYLPGVDDGPTSDAAAMAMVRLAVADGIQHAVVTPHLLFGVWENTLSSVRARFESFVELVNANQLPITFALGAEVRLDARILDLLAADEVPMLGEYHGKRVMLLELPDGTVPTGTMAFVDALRENNVVALIAHPERNRGVMRDPAVLRPLVDAGCLLQLTAGSITGRFGREAQRTSHRLLDLGWVSIVASDAHNTRARKPAMSEARAYLGKHYGVEAAELLTTRNPAVIAPRLAGTPTMRHAAAHRGPPTSAVTPTIAARRP